MMMEAISSSETSVLTTPHGITSHKTAFFIVIAVKTSNLEKVVSFIDCFMYDKQTVFAQQMPCM
jgi:hypothetical protein